MSKLKRYLLLAVLIVPILVVIQLFTGERVRVTEFDTIKHVNEKVVVTDKHGNIRLNQIQTPVQFERTTNGDIVIVSGERKEFSTIKITKNYIRMNFLLFQLDVTFPRTTDYEYYE